MLCRWYIVTVSPSTESAIFWYQRRKRSSAAKSSGLLDKSTAGKWMRNNFDWINCHFFEPACLLQLCYINVIRVCEYQNVCQTKQIIWRLLRHRVSHFLTFESRTNDSVLVFYMNNRRKHVKVVVDRDESTGSYHFSSPFFFFTACSLIQPNSGQLFSAQISQVSAFFASSIFKRWKFTSRCKRREKY